MLQAAIGSITLDAAREKGYKGKYQEKHGVQVNVNDCVPSIWVTNQLLICASKISTIRATKSISWPWMFAQ